MNPDKPPIIHWIPPGSEGETRPVYHFPRWVHPLVACPQCGKFSLSLTEAKGLAQDIRLWLIGVGHETVDEMSR